MGPGAELRLANGVTLLAKFDGEFASHSLRRHRHRAVHVVGTKALLISRVYVRFESFASDQSQVAASFDVRFTLKADNTRTARDVRLVPIDDISSSARAAKNSNIVPKLSAGHTDAVLSGLPPARAQRDGTP
jgi:hypothetical protein